MSLGMRHVCVALMMAGVAGAAMAQTAEPAATKPTTETPSAPATVAPPTAATPAATPAAAADETFEERLAKVDAAMAKVVDLRAEFEQKKKTALLKKPLTSKGTLVCKGESVLWKTTSPRESRMLVGPEKVTVFYPADKLAEVYEVGARFRDAAGGPLPRLSKLKERFEIVELVEKDLKELGLEGDALKDKLGVRLTPKDDELKKHVAAVRVVIDMKVPCAEMVAIADPDGDVTEIRFAGVKINSDVKDADLELKLPEGTKISTPTGGK